MILSFALRPPSFVVRQSMNAVILANGIFQPDARLRDLWRRADLRIAADGGARNARMHLDRAPDVVIGDLDSLDDATDDWLKHHNVERIQHPPAKDQTDLELAVDLSDTRGATAITILGAFGGRIDHWVANVLLLSRTPNVIMTDAASEMWAARDQAAIVGKPGDLVSLIPLDERIEGIVTEQLEYPLRAETLTRGSTRGISNVMLTNRATVHWTKGLVLIIHLHQSPQQSWG